MHRCIRLKTHMHHLHLHLHRPADLYCRRLPPLPVVMLTLLSR